MLLRYYLSDDLRGVSRFEEVRLTEYTWARIPDDNTDWLIGWQDLRGADPNFPDVPQGPIPYPATFADPANYQGGQGLGDPLYYNNFKNTDITVQVGARNRQVIESQALAWQDRIAAGYAKVRHPETGTIIDDVSQPIFGPTEWNADVWASYTGNLPLIDNDKIDWKIQLNIRNFLGEDDYIPVQFNPDGYVAVVRNPNPMDIYLTNTFSF